MSFENTGKETLAILTLTLSRICPQTRGLITSLLLIEIGTTFGTPVGMTNQMGSISSMASIVMALLMGLLSVRIKHRALLLTGLSILTLSSIGCYLAPSFTILVAIYALGGLGTNMVQPMVAALVDQHVSPDRRTNALSYLIAGNSLLYLLGMPLVNYLGDWKLSFLLFSVPLIVLSVLLSYFVVPVHEKDQTSTDVLAGYRGVFSSRSAVACLLGQAFGSGVWMITLSLVFSFFREVFLVSRGTIVFFTFGTSTAYIVGALSTRRFIPRLGWRRTTMFSLLLMGGFSVVYLLGLNLNISIIGVMLVSFLGGLNQSSAQGLNLGQLPELSGSMMSMLSAFQGIGTTLSLGIGGFILVWYEWKALGVLVGLLGFSGYLIMNQYATEPG